MSSQIIVSRLRLQTTPTDYKLFDRPTVKSGWFLMRLRGSKPISMKFGTRICTMISNKGLMLRCWVMASFSYSKPATALQLSEFHERNKDIHYFIHYFIIIHC